MLKRRALAFTPTHVSGGRPEREKGECGVLCSMCHEKFCAREFHDASLARCSLPKHAPPSRTASCSAPHARSRAYLWRSSSCSTSMGVGPGLGLGLGLGLIGLGLIGLDIGVWVWLGLWAMG